MILKWRLAAGLLVSSIIGTWIRVGIFKGTESLIPVQTLGCFLMGLFFGAHSNQDKFKSLFERHVIVYTILASGLSGSITTFSGWIASMINLLLIGAVWQAITELYVTLGVCYGALIFGMHCFRWFCLPYLIRSSRYQNSTEALDTRDNQPVEMSAVTGEADSSILVDESIFSFRLRPQYVQIISIVTTFMVYAALTLAGALFVWQTSSSVWAQFWIAMVFAPIGTFIRYGFALFFARYHPLAGTFFSNIIGTWIYAVMARLIYTNAILIGGQQAGLPVLVMSGVQEGLCGSLTTLSSLVVELMNSPPCTGALYFFLSLFFGMIPFYSIFGTAVR